MKVKELIVQYRTHPSGITTDARQLTDPIMAAGILIPLLRDQPQEVFLVLHLNARRQLLGVQEVTRGGIQSAHVSARTILTTCLGEKNSAALILAHNHPSGDPTPSQDDLDTTQTIIKAAEMFQIAVLDHLIIGDQEQGFCSLKQTGRMDHL